MDARIVARIVGVVTYLSFLTLVYSSTFVDKLPVYQKWISVVIFLVCAIPIFVVAHPLNLEARMNTLCYVIFKSVGSVGCYFLWNWVGSSLKISEDHLTMLASLVFACYVICMEFLFEVDKDIQICDGFLFAGFGLMLGQNRIPKWMVLCTCFVLCLVKNLLLLCKKKNKEDDINGGVVEGKTIMSVARTLATLSFVAVLIMVYSSTFLDHLVVYQKWLAVIFFLVCAVPLFPIGPPLNLAKRVNIFSYALCKSVGSVGCYFLYNWLGSSFKFHNDNHLMLASLMFAVYIIALDFLYEMDQDVEICDGYVFAGLGLMLAQKLISIWLVLFLCLILCLLKNTQQMYKKSNKVKQDDGKGKELVKVEDHGKVKQIVKVEDHGKVKQMVKVEDGAKVKQMAKVRDEGEAKGKDNGGGSGLLQNLSFRRVPT